MHRFRRFRAPRRRAATALAAALAAGATALAAGATGTGLSVAGASSHREAPLISGEPQLDTTDVYAFVSPDATDTVTLIANWIPFEEPAGGPTFYPFAPGAHYDINVDNDGDARADVTYRWTFTSRYRNPKTFLYNTGVVRNLTDSTLNFIQTYRLERIDEQGRSHLLVRDAVVAPSHVGRASMPDYGRLRRQATYRLGTRGLTYAGQADDPFFLDLRIFDLLYGGDLSERGTDTLAGYNVNTVVLRVPKNDLAAGGNAAKNPIIGVWSTTSRRSVRVIGANGTQTGNGAFVAVSRLGSPLVNEVVIPVGRKDRFNGSDPRQDAQFLPYVVNPEVPRLIQAIYKVPAPPTPRNDLVAVFLTGVKGLNSPAGVRPSEQLRLNLSIAPTARPKRLAVLDKDLAGYPNGRRLSDDVVDIALQVVEGRLLPKHHPLADTIGDKVDANDRAFSRQFPYVALPHAGSATRGSGAAAAALSAATAASPTPTATP